MPSRNRKVSIRDVAERAEVSLGTVSNVLNTPDKVKKETRERVREAMSELGFVRSFVASQLRKQASPLVGIIVLDIKNPFFMEAAAAIEKRLRRDDCYIMLASSDGSALRESKLIDLYASMDVRGIILSPCDTAVQAGSASLESRLEELGIPVVLFDHPPINETIPAVYVDDRVGEEQAVAHLLQLGHRKIAFINGPAGFRQSHDRLAGARAAFESYGLLPDELLVLTAEQYRSPEGASAVRRIIAEHPEITAIACANDLLAMGTIGELRNQGLRVPEDVSVIGYDDIDIAHQLSIPLTSIHQPMNGMGWLSASKLVGPEDVNETQALVPELVVRASTAPPRSCKEFKLGRID